MAAFKPVPKHIAATFLPDEAYDLFVTLRSAVREFEGVPESVVALVDNLAAVLTDDPKEADNLGLKDDDGGSAVTI